ncbi:MAG: hypothetical protein ABJN51_15900, partial [Sneathiella sp.]
REQETLTVSIRDRNGQDIGTHSLEKAENLMQQEARAPDSHTQEAILNSLMERLGGLSNATNNGPGTND